MIMTNQTFRRKLVWSAQAAFVALALALGLGAGTSVFAQKAENLPLPKAAAPQTAGRQAAHDDKNNKDNSDAKALSDAMKQQFNRSTEAVEITNLPNGVMAKLPEDFMEVSVIKINPDGSASVECVTGMKAAEESIKTQGAGATAAKPAQKATVPPVKGETGKTPRKTSEDKSKWEVM
jgi:hypothetical protein